MAYDFLIIEDVIADDILEELEPGLGRGLAISTKAEFMAFVESHQMADVALCDLRWRDDGSGHADFDGLDAIAALVVSGQCQRVILLTDGGSPYRHWIEEAKRSPIVVGGILKPARNLAEVIARILAGERYWNIIPAGRDGDVVVDILGTTVPTASGRLIAAMLDEPDYAGSARRLFVSQGTVKSLAPQLMERLSDIGEVLKGKPLPALAGWIGENREYLLGWRRRVLGQRPSDGGASGRRSSP